MTEAGQLSIRIFDVTGRALRNLWDGPQAAGRHELVWDGRDEDGHALASGVYFLKFRAGDIDDERKLVLLK